jgi:hypothetical protein
MMTNYDHDDKATSQDMFSEHKNSRVFTFFIFQKDTAQSEKAVISTYCFQCFQCQNNKQEPVASSFIKQTCESFVLVKHVNG